MIFKDISFDLPQDNILYDEVLLEMAEQGKAGEILRLWESPVHFIVLGRTGRLKEEVFLDQARQDNIPVLRRSSGGGTVLEGRGCLNFSLILSKERPGLGDIRKSYMVILDKIIQVMGRAGVRCGFRPPSDLVLEPGENKISGNAQRRARRFILHHGTVLYDFDIPLIERYLTIPLKLPEYRKGRSHRDFLANVPILAPEIREHFRACFSAQAQNHVPEPEETLLFNDLRMRKNILMT